MHENMIRVYLRCHSYDCHSPSSCAEFRLICNFFDGHKRGRGERPHWNDVPAKEEEVNMKRREREVFSIFIQLHCVQAKILLHGLLKRIKSVLEIAHETSFERGEERKGKSTLKGGRRGKWSEIRMMTEETVPFCLR